MKLSECMHVHNSEKKQAVTTIYNKYTIFLLKCGCVSSITKIVTW